MKTSQERRITLRDLFKENEEVTINPELLDIEVSGISQDSRKIKPGYVFVAIQGVEQNGVMFIPHAVANGAAIILGDDELMDAFTVPTINAANPRQALSLAAARFYQQQPQFNVAVTGTNGKTSTVHFCQQIWQGIAKKSACVGTTGIIDFDGKFEYERENFLTTPDSVKLHDILSQLAQKGVTHLAMEASSHGLDQYRLDGVKIAAAAFTNITRDHLDYHGSFEAYLEAKLRLFKELLPEGKIAILNADIEAFSTLEKTCSKRKQRIISYGFKGKDIRFIEITPHTQGTQVKWSVFGKEYEVDLKLIGQFQVYNLAAAIGLIMAEEEVEMGTLMSILPSIEAVYGRMQLVTSSVFVDYAHTPDALENALTVLKPHTSGKLWVVFGCGGNRDEGKRALMGKVAHDFADHVVITDDNPRHEKPEAIRQQVASACPDAHNIADRGKAIAYAMQSMQEGDVLLVAGKGHEQYQIIGDEMRPYSDVSTIKELAA